MRVEQEQRVTEDARIAAQQEVTAQRYAVHILQVLYCNNMPLLQCRFYVFSMYLRVETRIKVLDTF